MGLQALELLSRSLDLESNTADTSIYFRHLTSHLISFLIILKSMNALLPATMHMELTSRAPTWMSDFIKITTRAYLRLLLRLPFFLWCLASVNVNNFSESNGTHLWVMAQSQMQPPNVNDPLPAQLQTFVLLLIWVKQIITWSRVGWKRSPSWTVLLILAASWYISGRNLYDLIRGSSF